MDEKEFFDRIEQFRKERNEQKLRGLNDYNPLTTVLRHHDEVRLHSRMIGSLLDTQGDHYQGDLFLREFLRELNLQEFFNSLDKVRVNVEYKDIDLYLTDDEKHIIIENKIWAEDQPCQVIRYINYIVNDKNSNLKEHISHDKIDADVLRVVYLTPKKDKDPDDHEINNGYITFSAGEEQLKECSKKEHTKDYTNDALKNYKAKYQRVGYKKEILNWLKNSQKEISNITNLNSAIQYYIDAVKQVVGDHKSVLKQYKDLFMEKEMYQAFTRYGDMFKEGDEIHNGFIEAQQILYNRYFCELLKPLIDSDDFLEFYKYDIKNQKIILQYQEYFEIWIMTDKNRLKSLGIRPAWGILEWQGNWQIHNILDKTNSALQKNRDMHKYVIGNNKGILFSIENTFQEVTDESLFFSQDPLELNEIREHIKTIKKMLES